MTAIERRWRDVLLAAMIPALPAPAMRGIDSIALGSFWEKFRHTAPWLLRFGFRFAVIVLTWWPLPGYRRSFAGLSSESRDEFLQRLAGSRSYAIRQLVTVVKLVACMAYFSDGGVQSAIRGPAAAALP